MHGTRACAWCGLGVTTHYRHHAWREELTFLAPDTRFYFTGVSSHLPGEPGFIPVDRQHVPLQRLGVEHVFDPHGLHFRLADVEVGQGELLQVPGAEVGSQSRDVSVCQLRELQTNVGKYNNQRKSGKHRTTDVERPKPELSAEA